MTDPVVSAPQPAGTVLPPGLVAEFMQTYLDDKRRERRRRLIWRVIWVVLLIVVAVGLFQRVEGEAAVSSPHTALIEVNGAIAEDEPANADALTSALRDAFEDSGSRAVVLRISSPGGSPVQAGIVNAEIRRLKALHKKPVYAVCEEMCASAAYYIAVGADQIFVDKASIVGSIGVLMNGFGFTGAMEKLGIERRLLTAGSNKGLLDPFSPLEERHRAYAQALLDQIHQQFITVVREGRGKRLKETPETFSGLFWSGQQAVANGLADRYGSLDEVARDVVKAEDIIDYTPKENVAERLAKRFGAAVGAGAVKALGTGAAIR
ncbi:MAG: S49 family peptidase [Aquabacterium sp.]|nr:S49 family peptidase [Aquabacterium sp.]